MSRLVFGSLITTVAATVVMLAPTGVAASPGAGAPPGGVPGEPIVLKAGVSEVSAYGGTVTWFEQRQRGHGREPLKAPPPSHLMKLVDGQISRVAIKPVLFPDFDLGPGPGGAPLGIYPDYPECRRHCEIHTVDLETGARKEVQRTPARCQERGPAIAGHLVAFAVGRKYSRGRGSCKPGLHVVVAERYSDRLAKEVPHWVDLEGNRVVAEFSNRTSQPGTTRIVLYDGAAGTVQEIAAGTRIGSHVGGALSNGTLYHAHFDFEGIRVIGRDLATGAEVYRSPVLGPIDSLAADGGRIYFTNTEGLWTLPTGIP